MRAGLASMHAVGAVMQGAEQGEQILHMLAAIQAFDIDRLEAQPGALADFGNQRIKVAARPDQHGNTASRAPPAGPGGSGPEPDGLRRRPHRPHRPR